MTKATAFYFQAHTVPPDIGRVALRGGIISVVSGYGSGALQIIGAVVLARLLMPDDFGLVSIIAALTSFAPMLIDFGMADATIQKRQITEGQVSSLFWINCGIGLAVAAGLAACSPVIASLYHEPRLQSVALGSAIMFALSGAAAQHLSLLRRTLQYTTIAKIQFLGVISGVAVAVMIAMGGGGYWALVFRPIANAAFVTAGAWIACSWRPGPPVFDSEVKSMVRFGSHVVGFSIVYSIGRAVDRMLLGLLYSATEVGYYQNAIVLYDNSIFSALGQLHNVGSAALSKLQSEPVALAQKYEAALSTLAFFLMPVAAILSLTAQDVVVVLLGDRWRAAGAVLAIVALRGIFQAIEGSQGWLHLSLGRADRWKNWGVVSTIVLIVAVLCGLPFGINGVAIATVIASALLALPSISYAGRPAGIGAALVVRATGQQFIGSVLCLAAGWLFQCVALQQVASVPRALASTCLSVAVYLLIVVGLFRQSGPLAVIGRLVNQQLPPRVKTWMNFRILRGRAMRAARPEICTNNEGPLG
jgi:PST family polysaccharide transporter